MGDHRVKNFWDVVRLRAALQELSRRCSEQDLIYVVDYLENRSIPKWKEPIIDWDKVEIGNIARAEDIISPDVLHPALDKLKKKMERLQKEVEEKKSRGEKLELDD